MKRIFGFFIDGHLVRTLLNYFRIGKKDMVVKNTAIFFNPRAQAAVEYFVLLIVFALITLISVSTFFNGDNNIVDYMRDNFFAPAVERLLR